MSIKDVIKKSFLENFQGSDMSIRSIVICLAAAALMGIFIFLVYRLMTTNSFYSKSFNMSLMFLCVITAAIILTIQNSVVVSLGMVGALSIVRFRTAVKEPLDLVFLFWSIAAGIICGTGILGMAAAMSLIVAFLMVVFHYFPERRNSFMLAIELEHNKLVPDVVELVKKYDSHCCMKSRNIAETGVNLLLEIRLKDCEPLLQELDGTDGVRSISVIAHRGESVY